MPTVDTFHVHSVESGTHESSLKKSNDLTQLKNSKKNILNNKWIIHELKQGRKSNLCDFDYYMPTCALKMCKFFFSIIRNEFSDPKCIFFE